MNKTEFAETAEIFEFVIQGFKRIGCAGIKFHQAFTAHGMRQFFRKLVIGNNRPDLPQGQHLRAQYQQAKQGYYFLSQLHEANKNNM